ncbi:hypothetical protein SteCoe_15455 [Stentor coeruleus]|uniref:Major facilitator superfamily (MFS) profile domain-containing protein n=1 Tax=Stentor coeruleus TaxID=5963 RepID=A0A1R2C3K3_9CILI|nr:hypothetical protein SteCoe_15455 [Stentor coeruleus]
MCINDALEEIGWGKYQELVYSNCFLAILLATLWMEMVSLLMHDYEGEYWEIFLLPVCLNFGSLIGCYLQSFITDKVGRASIFKLSAIISSFGGLWLCVFPFSFMFHIGLCIIGFGLGGDMVISYTLLLESIPKSKINQLTLLNMGWNIGISFFIFTALIIELFWVFNSPGWMILVWVGTLSAGFLTYYRSRLLESPHYLYNRGDFRLDGVLIKIAEINENKDYIPRVFLRIQDKNVFENDHEKMLKNTILLTCEYFFANTPYYCLIFFMPDILPDCNDYMLYTVMFLQQLSGIPGVITASYLINSPFGPKYTRLLGFTVSAVFMFSLSLPLNDYLIFVVSCALFYFLSIGLSTLYTFSQEMYPTAIRGTANGWLCGISLITGCIGPVLFGQIKNMTGITPIFYILTVSFVLAAVFSFGIVDYTPKKAEYIN